MRKILFILVALLWLAAGIQVIEGVHEEDEEQLVEAFHNTNCIEAQSEVLAEGELKEYLTIERQKELLKAAAAELGIESNYTIEEKQDGSRHVVELCRNAAQAQVQFSLVTVEEEQSGAVVDSTQYITMRITLYDNLECAVVYRSAIEEFLEKWLEDADVSMQFHGERKGRLGKEECSALTGQLLHDISAKKKSEWYENGVYTVYGYTDLAGEYETIKGEKINVMIAVTYDEIEDATKLYIATPVIKGDY